MHVIETSNVNTALHSALFYLDQEGIEEDSRNGKVLVAPGPVTTVYENSQQRVLFSPMRDANPFFHLMEALWMLAGRYDAAFPTYFNSNFTSFSDDGVTIHGAYGHRWRRWFNTDQLNWIINELRANPASRRCVLTMWDACAHKHPALQDSLFEHTNDPLKATTGGKDVPCNTHAYVDVRGGYLNLTVCCRSNDIWWGCYGANAVHFSILQEYLAGMIGVAVGKYYQISNNFHIYTDVVKRENFGALMRDAFTHNLYDPPQPNLFGQECELEVCNSVIDMFPLWEDKELWKLEFINDFIDNATPHNEFLEHVALPMRRAFEWRKEKRGAPGINHRQFLIDTMIPCDWRSAAINWIQRRDAKKEGQ